MKCRATLLERDMLFTSLAFVPLALGAPPLGAGAGAQKIEAPTVPARFHGEWARTAEQCGLSAAAVENLTIGSRHILSVPVVRVEQAANSGRVKVWLRPADRSAQELVLELNGDVLVVTTQDGQSVEAVNCSRQEPDFSLAIENSWLELASAACQSGNFNDFLEAFFSSEAVKRKYLERKILVVREGAPGKFVDQAFYSAPPIMLSHYQGEMNCAGRWLAKCSGSPLRRQERQAGKLDHFLGHFSSRKRAHVRRKSGKSPSGRRACVPPQQDLLEPCRRAHWPSR